MIPTDADTALYHTIVDVLGGQRVSTPKDTSFELLNYTTGMSNPRGRIITHPERPLNVVSALARFTWLFGGNNRLEDIAFYEPKVRAYSDNGLTVPGSSYGHRLFDSRPGLNQIAGVIARLRTNPLSRQAASVVWLPEDAVRESVDIPCTFGMFFHVREDADDLRRLTMTTVMRSNNAFRIMPYNLFEFSMLQEIVAASLNLPLGDYMHWAASMHVYVNDQEMPHTEQIARVGPSVSIIMPPMTGDNAFNQAAQLARYEAQLRHTYTHTQFDEVVSKANSYLDWYWYGLFSVLALWNTAKRGWNITHIVQEVPDYLKENVMTVINRQFGALTQGSGNGQ